MFEKALFIDVARISPCIKYPSKNNNSSINNSSSKYKLKVFLF